MVKKIGPTRTVNIEIVLNAVAVAEGAACRRRLQTRSEPSISKRKIAVVDKVLPGGSIERADASRGVAADGDFDGASGSVARHVNGGVGEESYAFHKIGAARVADALPEGCARELPIHAEHRAVVGGDGGQTVDYFFAKPLRVDSSENQNRVEWAFDFW